MATPQQCFAETNWWTPCTNTTLSHKRFHWFHVLLPYQQSCLQPIPTWPPLLAHGIGALINKQTIPALFMTPLMTSAEHADTRIRRRIHHAIS